MEPPRCFISYSWDSVQHQEWVRKLSTRLLESGIDAILDQFECAPGTDLTRFMEKSVRESNFVLLVCTPNFAHKADAGVGGVGYEKTIVTGEIFAGEAGETKYIPLLREGDAKESLPSYLKSRLFIDFRDDAFFENRLEELLRHFYGEPLYPKPSIGHKPDWRKPVISKTENKPTITKPEKKPKVIKPPQKPIVSKPAKKPSPPPRFKIAIGMEFVLIPPGSFMMGCKLSPEEVVRRYIISFSEKSLSFLLSLFEDEHPQHQVTISKPFYLQSTQVTQIQWQKIMGDNPSRGKARGDNCPVESVNWYDAQDFIEKLNDKENSDKYRLPTEAEWEYACRAGTITSFFFGDDFGKLTGYAWYNNNSKRNTQPVGNKKPNNWGLYDMHGNVCEWCQDWHGDYPINSVVDPKGPDKGDKRVNRGGCWDSPEWFLRSAKRDSCNPDFHKTNVGFRIARDL